jgi:hypothetical protein
MNFSLLTSLQILERTPDVLIAMLRGIADEWTMSNEGDDTWSVYDIIGHLIYGEKTDWVPRMNMILSVGNKTFESFDRFAQYEASKGKSLAELLDDFKQLRDKNIILVKAKNITLENLMLKGIHPAFGEITLSQLLATWTVHDLNHISQVARVMAKQYKETVGPWVSYLKILN